MSTSFNIFGKSSISDEELTKIIQNQNLKEYYLKIEKKKKEQEKKDKKIE